MSTLKKWLCSVLLHYFLCEICCHAYFYSSVLKVSFPLAALKEFLSIVGFEQSFHVGPWCVCVCVRTLSRFHRVRLFATLWTVAHQAPLSMGFSRQEHCSGLPCPAPVYLLTQGSNLCLLQLLHWQGSSLPLSHWGGLRLTSVTYILGCLYTDISHGSLMFFPFLSISLCFILDSCYCEVLKFSNLFSAICNLLLMPSSLFFILGAAVFFCFFFNIYLFACTWS